MDEGITVRGRLDGKVITLNESVGDVAGPVEIVLFLPPTAVRTNCLQKLGLKLAAVGWIKKLAGTALVKKIKPLWKIFAVLISVAIVFALDIRKCWTLGCIASFLALPAAAYDIFTVRSRIWRRRLLYSYLALFIFVNWAFSGFFLERGLIGPFEKPITHFCDALYFSVVTWTTVGYGDIRPTADVRLWAAGEALYGYIYMSLLIAQVLQLLSGIGNRTER
jgi:hypothetical protein